MPSGTAHRGVRVVHAHVSEMGLRNMSEVSRCYSLQILTLVVVRPTLEVPRVLNRDTFWISRDVEPTEGHVSHPTHGARAARRVADDEHEQKV